MEAKRRDNSSVLKSFSIPSEKSQIQKMCKWFLKEEKIAKPVPNHV